VPGEEYGIGLAALLAEVERLFGVKMRKCCRLIRLLPFIVKLTVLILQNQVEIDPISILRNAYQMRAVWNSLVELNFTRNLKCKDEFYTLEQVQMFAFFVSHLAHILASALRPHHPYLEWKQQTLRTS
jgi:hypothetical protein